MTTWNSSSLLDLESYDLDEAAAETNKVKAENFTNYNDYVAAKIKTIPSSIIVLLTQASIPSDKYLLNSIQAAWLSDFWSSRAGADNMKN